MDKEPKCVTCKHEEIYHVIPEKHVNGNKNCTKADCLCIEYCGMK